MTRKEKVKLLQAIKAGLLLPEDIRPAKVYVFFQYKEGGWEMRMKTGDNKLYTDAEAESLINQIQDASDRRVKCGLEPDHIIRVVYDRQCKPRKDMR